MPVGGRAPVDYQMSHTVPKRLFKNGLENPLIDLFKTLPGWEAEFDLLGEINPADNIQPLPDDPIPGGSSVHNGSHPTITKIMDARLTAAHTSIMDSMGADVIAANNGDVAAQNRLKKAIGDKLRQNVQEVQFKSTNFMDVDPPGGGPVRERFVYNRRDLAYLKQTTTWANATPLERALATAGLDKSKLIDRHNQLVNGIDLATRPERSLEMQVLKDFGERGLAHTDGTPVSRDAIRAIIGEARAQRRPECHECADLLRERRSHSRGGGAAAHAADRQHRAATEEHVTHPRAARRADQPARNAVRAAIRDLWRADLRRQRDSHGRTGRAQDRHEHAR